MAEWVPICRQPIHTILPKLLFEVSVVLELFSLCGAEVLVCAGVKVLLEASIGEECPTPAVYLSVMGKGQPLLLRRELLGVKAELGQFRRN